jgi:hypothetical protein
MPISFVWDFSACYSVKTFINVSLAGGACPLPSADAVRMRIQATHRFRLANRASADSLISSVDSRHAVVGSSGDAVTVSDVSSDRIDRLV